MKIKAIFFAKLCVMIGLMSEEFDRAYEELSQLLDEDTKAAYKNIKKYIIPKYVQADNNNNIKVRSDDELPKVFWKPLIDLHDLEKGKSGIYVIKNDITNQLYFGKASDFKERISDHAESKKRDSKFLHAAIDYAKAHPEENITFSWAVYTEAEKNKETLNQAEKDAIKSWNTFASNFDYNLTPGGDGGGHPKYTEEQIAQVRNLAMDKTKFYSVNEISEKTKVDIYTVKDIIEGKHYSGYGIERNPHQFTTANSKDTFVGFDKSDTKLTTPMIKVAGAVNIRRIEDPDYFKDRAEKNAGKTYIRKFSGRGNTKPVNFIVLNNYMWTKYNLLDDDIKRKVDMLPFTWPEITKYREEE